MYFAKPKMFSADSLDSMWARIGIQGVGMCRPVMLLRDPLACHGYLANQWVFMFCNVGDDVATISCFSATVLLGEGSCVCMSRGWQYRSTLLHQSEREQHSEDWASLDVSCPDHPFTCLLVVYLYNIRIEDACGVSSPHPQSNPPTQSAGTV